MILEKGGERCANDWHNMVWDKISIIKKRYIHIHRKD